MTDRVKGFIVTLEEDARIDHIEVVMQSIRLIRGVADVQPSISDSSDHINQMRVKSDLRNKLWKFINENM